MTPPPRSLAFALTAAFTLLCAIAPAHAGTPGKDLLLPLGGAPSWVLTPPGGPAPTIDMNFATGQYYGLQPSRLAVTRASPDNEVCNGTLYTFLANTAPITPCGLWSWEARTNSIRNNTMIGAAAGSPGTQPTNWSVGLNGTTQQIVATGTLGNGMPYVDVRLSGTTTGQFFSQCFDTLGGAPVFGGTYTHSFYVALAASPNVANIGQYGIKVSDGPNLFAKSITPTATLTQYSISFTETFTTGFQQQPCLYFNMTGASGQAIDVTFRLALPQLELNPNIAASVASATVAGGGAAYVGASGTMTWSGAGCATNPVLNVTTSAGAINAVTSVATAGSCATFPAAGATTWTPGGGLSVGTGASFNLVPTDNSAQAFATGPILTSGTAVTRAANVISGNITNCINTSTRVLGTPFASLNSGVDQIPAALTSTTNSSAYFLIRRLSSGVQQSWAYDGTTFNLVGASSWSTNTSAIATGYANGSLLFNSFNKNAAVSGTWVSSQSFNKINIGSQGGLLPWNGSISRVTVACEGSLIGL